MISGLNRSSKFRLVLSLFAQKGQWGGDGAEDLGDRYLPLPSSQHFQPPPLLLPLLSVLLDLGQDTFYFLVSNS